MKVLAVASEPISAEQLRAAVGRETLEDVEVMVVAPALHESALRFWLSDADGAIARAEQVERESVDQLRRADVRAAGEVGESDVELAIRDALETFPAERVLLFRHAADEQRYREDVDPEELGAHIGVVVEVHELPRSD